MVLLLRGSCGKFEYTVIPDVANLFVALLRTASPNESEALLTNCLRQLDDFLLGDAAKKVSLSVLSRLSSDNQENPLCVCDLEKFLQDVWQLHRVEDTDALPLSDAVARFLEEYSI